MTFSMWSLFHIIFILSPFIFTGIMYYFTKDLGYQKNRKIGIILSIVCIIILVLRNLEILFISKEMTPELIPLQICHFANIVLLIAFLKDNKSMFATAFCFNLPCALLAIIFANSLENYANILTFRGLAYIFGHLLIVGITLWSLLIGFMKVTIKDAAKGLIFILSMFILSIPINNLFNYLMPDYSSNYFYSIKPEGGTPLVAMFKLGHEIIFLGMKMNLVYILLFLILGTAVFGVLYFISSILNKVFKFQTLKNN